MNNAKMLQIFDVPSLEQRVSWRVPVPAHEKRALLKANVEQRAQYTFSKIVNHAELWTVWDGEELPTFESSFNDVVHIWPHKEFAELGYSRTISIPKFVPIPVDDFINEVLYRDSTRDIDVAIFPTGVEYPCKIMPKEIFSSEVGELWRRSYGPVPSS